MQLKNILIENILSNENSFDILAPDVPVCRLLSTDFVDSIKKDGVLQPVYGIEKDDKIKLISGFKRYRAAVVAELKSIPVIVIPPETSFKDQIQLCYNLAAEEKSLPIMAMARLLQLGDCDVINPDHTFRERLKKLMESPVEVQNYFQKYDAPLSTVSTFLRQAKEDILKIIDFANKFRVRPVELEKIILDVADCAKICDADFKNIWQELTINLPENCEGKNRNKFLKDFKQKLSEKKYPQLSKLREESKNAVKDLKKLCKVKADFDPTFESPEINLNLTFKNIKELEGIFGKLLSEEGRRALEELIK